MDITFSHSGALANATPSCCPQLSSLLGPNVFFPDSSVYNTTLSSYWSLQEASLYPSCIVVPTSTQDVSRAISLLSNNTHCPFAIKGQTHMPGAGFANIDTGGVTIDMTNLTFLALSADGKVVSVGAGARWLDVYKYLDPFNLTAAGGRNGLVGVGGLTLGGGISYFGPRVGWTCDTVSNFEIVLAGGDIVNANATENVDLYRALKGGTNNFGVLTQVSFDTIPQGPIVAGHLLHNIAYVDRVFEAFANIADAPHYDFYASLVMGLVWATGAWELATTAIYTKEDLHPAVYKELREDIPTESDMFNVTRLGVLSDEANTNQTNQAFYTSTYAVSADLLSNLFRSWNETISTTEIPGGVVWIFAIEPIPTVFTSHSQFAGGNSLGVSPDEGNLVVVLLSPEWPSTSDNALVHATAQKMIENAREIAKRAGLLNKFLYANYGDKTQDVIDGYGWENVERLRRVSSEVDPRGVFQKQVPGGFKVMG